MAKATYSYKFQSTLPLRGATASSFRRVCPGQFQSTLPLRGATTAQIEADLQNIISIHAPLTGSDVQYLMGFEPESDFNPRSPYGERLLLIRPVCSSIVFQSTLPLRGATTDSRALLAEFRISIHAPLTGSDSVYQKNWIFMGYFNPRSPYGERPSTMASRVSTFYFNPRSPYGERHHVIYHLLFRKIFQSTLPLRGATGNPPKHHTGRGFQSTLPLRGATIIRSTDRAHHQFQSTLPLRGATFSSRLCTTWAQISIHAPLTGSDAYRLPSQPHLG